MLKTNSAITVMNRAAILPSETTDKVVYGRVDEVNTSFERNGVDVMFTYYEIIIFNEGGEDEYEQESPIKTSSKFFSYPEMQAVKDSLTIPTGLSEKDEMIFKYREALRIKMAEAFNIDISGIVDM